MKTWFLAQYVHSISKYNPRVIGLIPGLGTHISVMFYLGHCVLVSFVCHLWFSWDKKSVTCGEIDFFWLRYPVTSYTCRWTDLQDMTFEIWPSRYDLWDMTFEIWPSRYDLWDMTFEIWPLMLKSAKNPPKTKIKPGKNSVTWNKNKLNRYIQNTSKCLED